MSPSTTPFIAMRSLAIRPRRHLLFASQRVSIVSTRRTFAEDRSTNQHNVLPEAEKGDAGPNMQQQEHVSEEAAKMAKIQGGQGPDIEGQGTPVQDILKNEKDVQKQAPKVMKESLKNSGPPGSRSFSTQARRRAEETVAQQDTKGAPLDASMIPSESQRAKFEIGSLAEMLRPVVEQKSVGVHKFPLPSLPLQDGMKMKKRNAPILDQVIGLIMQDGKKARAQRNLNTILTTLRTNPAPTYDPSRPLIPGAPPASYLPLHPVQYLTLAVDSVAPLMRLRSQKGAAGGGVALQIPVALHQRQRRRVALNWILDAASKRKSRGSGPDMFAQRVAEEIVSVVEGRSAIWERRAAVHRLATTARTNLAYGSRRGKRF